MLIAETGPLHRPLERKKLLATNRTMKLTV
jgi:hypothetical protein